jgi:diguanylate cyclase (GGDEF)-like protein
MVQAIAGLGKRPRFQWLAVQVCLIHCLTAWALDPGRAITQYVQSSWNTESGLPQNTVLAITQTPDGYLWIATEGGLAQFDGVKFTTYDHDNTPGLPPSIIMALAVGTDGNLWVGTDSGLVAFQRSETGGWRVASQTITASDGLLSNRITALWEAPDGVLWVGTRKGLQRVIAGRVQLWPGTDSPVTAEVDAICPGTGGTLWIGTFKGLYRIDGSQIRFVKVSGAPPGASVSSLAATGDGSLWVGTEDQGIFEMREGSFVKPPVRLPSNNIESLHVDKDGGLWIGLEQNGIGRLYKGKLSLYDSTLGLPSDRTTQGVYEDAEGNLWMGLLDTGLLELRDGKFAVFGKPEGLNGNMDSSVLQARDGTLWIGLNNNELNHVLLDGRVEIWNHRNGLPDSVVYSLLESRDGSIWVGFHNGMLARIRGRSVTTYADPDAKTASLTVIFEDRDGHLWTGFAGRGLALFDNRRFHYIDSIKQVIGIAQTPDGALWLGSYGEGIERVFRGQLTRFTTRDGLPDDQIISIYADSNGDVWSGSVNGGLSRIRGGKMANWGPRQGLHETIVASIIEDNLGNLWFDGDKGIYSVPLAELERTAGDANLTIHPVQYDPTSGLRSRETVYGCTPSSWKARDGRLWFATIRGAAVIDPAHMPVDRIVPPVRIESILYNARALPLRDGIRLKPGSANLEVAFTAPSFVVPQQVRFRYRLVGFDAQWVDAGTRRYASYTNLPPGSYTFVVEAENSDGVWSRGGASFQFLIPPPFGRTPFAYACYVLMVLLLGWAVLVLRTRALIRRQHELRRVVAERTLELRAEKAALEVARRELQIQATHDSLTHLFNRAAIVEHLEREMSRALRDNAALGVAIADLDYFKKVNDNYGHLCGDQILVECAARFRSALRGYDVIGRYGGEEFLILFPGWDLSTSPERVSDLLNAIGGSPFVTYEAELRMTCSFGVAVFDLWNDDPASEEILRRADAALYLAKNAGRNCVRFEARCLDEPEQLSTDR